MLLTLLQNRGATDALVQLPAVASTMVVNAPVVGQATWTARPGVSMGVDIGGFYEYKPPFYVAGKSSALISLHGIGDLGDGNGQLNLLLNNGIPKHINNLMGTADQFPYDMLVIVPQYNSSSLNASRLQSIVNYVRANYDFDKSRLHITALSLGSDGATNWLNGGTLTHVASMSMLCTPSVFYQPGADNAKAANMPTLFVHGLNDSNPFTPWEKSRDWAQGLKNIGISPESIFFPMPGYDHNCWDDLYYWPFVGYLLVDGTRDVYQWHDQYSRSDGITLTKVPSTMQVFAPTVSGGTVVIALPSVASTMQVFTPSVIRDNAWALVKAAIIPGPNNRPSLAALNSNTVVLHDEASDRMSVLIYDGTNFVEGASLIVPGSNSGHLAGLNSSEFAYLDGSLRVLRRYKFDGSSITLMGSELDLNSLSPAISSPALARLGSGRVVMVDQNNKALRAYDWIGNTWVAIGTPLANVGGFAPDMVALTPSRFVVWDGDDGRLSVYDFDGSTFTLFAQNDFSFNTTALARLTPSRIAYINDGDDTLKVLDLVGTNFVDQGINASLSNVFYPALAGLSANRTAFIDQNNDELRIYEYAYSGTQEQNIECNTVASTMQVFAPAVSLNVQLPAVASTLVVNAPAIVVPPSVVQLPAVASTLVVRALTVTRGSVTVSLPAVGSTLTVNAITLLPGAATIALPSVASTLQVRAPIVTSEGGLQYVNLSFVPSTMQVRSPVVLPGQVNLQLPSVASTLQVFNITVERQDFIVLGYVPSTLQVFPIIVGPTIRKARFRVTLID
jgi:hypothetical protein